MVKNLTMNQEDIKSRLEKDPHGLDAAGDSLLHRAARSGDAALVELCLKAGVKTLTYNKDGDCARDVARMWGHDAIAALLDAEMKKERAAMPRPPLPYASLQEIRDRSTAEGVNLFHVLAALGNFDQVAALAQKDPGGLTAQDLLSTGADGETVILKICQQGQLMEVAKPELWFSNTVDFLAVWDKAPVVCRKGLDIGSFMDRARQFKLQHQSRAAGDKSPFKKGPGH